MSAIFRGAKITITANLAKNANQGTGICDPLPGAIQILVTEKDLTRTREASVRYPPVARTIEAFEAAPVHKRGWIFQEGMLWQRIIHILSGELVWQCHTVIDSENGLFRGTYPLPAFREQLYRSTVPVFNLPRKAFSANSFEGERPWWDWAVSHAERKLTFHKDVFAALGGMVRNYEEMSGDEPVLGLWRKNLVVTLAWDIVSCDWKEVPHDLWIQTSRLSSWTWMSLPIPFIRSWVITKYKYYDPSGITANARIDDVQIAWSGISWSSWPTKGELTISGKVIDLTLPNSGESFLEWLQTFTAEEPTLRGDLKLDRRMPPNTPSFRENFVALVLWSTSFKITFLVIEPIGDKAGEYRRIGSGGLYNADLQAKFNRIGKNKMIILL